MNSLTNDGNAYVQRGKQYGRVNSDDTVCKQVKRLKDVKEHMHIESRWYVTMRNTVKVVFGGTWWDYEKLQEQYPQIHFSYFQSNVEGELINALQDFGSRTEGILLNAAAYTHTSVGLDDCIKAIDAPVLEIHISNTFAREDFRHTSYITPVAKGLIVGFGLDSYRLGVESFLAAK